MPPRFKLPSTCNILIKLHPLPLFRQLNKAAPATSGAAPGGRQFRWVLRLSGIVNSLRTDLFLSGRLSCSRTGRYCPTNSVHIGLATDNAANLRAL
jgi:hypothetical protein